MGEWHEGRLGCLVKVGQGQPIHVCRSASVEEVLGWGVLPNEHLGLPMLTLGLGSVVRDGGGIPAGIVLVRVGIFLEAFKFLTHPGNLCKIITRGHT